MKSTLEEIGAAPFEPEVVYETLLLPDGAGKHMATHVKVVKAKCIGPVLDLLMEKSKFKRICYYALQGFVYADNKPPIIGDREYYICDGPNYQWKFFKELK